MKKVLVTLIALTLSITLTGCGSKKEPVKPEVSTNETGDKINNSENLNKDKTFGNYKVTEISLKTEEGVNTLKATIENISETDTEQGLYNIVFTDSTGKEITKIAVFLKALKPNEKIEIKSTINLNVIESYDFKLVKA